MRKLILISLLAMVNMACGKKGGGQQETIPNLSFEDIALPEGNGGINNVTLTLKLNHSYSKVVSVTYSTVNGTAKAGSDFTAVTSQSVTFQPNETEKPITISVVADDLKEGNETFQVKVENPTNVFLTKGTATVTLQNDDTKVGFNNTGYDAANTYPGMSLVWSDEFNGTSLDPATWTFEMGDGCPNICGWGNNELEYYTNSADNLFFQDGKMIIEAKAETYGGKSYTSARIKTQGKKTFKFGRIDIRAILPVGKGIWPALWMLPQDNVYGGWPTSGEIDIMENVGSEPSKVLGTAHYGPGPGSTYISRNYFLNNAAFHDQFHVFSLEWKNDELKWYVDDVLFSTITKADVGSNTWPFNEQFFFVVNLAVGGNLPGSPDANTEFPQWFIVDYIRVYQ